jgi:hypothetical protein
MILHEEFPDIKVKCHAFACPCVVSPDLSMKYRHFITTYVLENDIVPRISLGSLEALRAEALVLLQQSGSNNFKRYAEMSRTTETENRVRTHTLGLCHYHTRLLKAADLKKRLNPFRGKRKKSKTNALKAEEDLSSSQDSLASSRDDGDEYYDDGDEYYDEYYEEGGEYDEYNDEAIEETFEEGGSPTASHSDSPPASTPSTPLVSSPSSSATATASGQSTLTTSPSKSPKGADSLESSGDPNDKRAAHLSESMLVAQDPSALIQQLAGRQTFKYTCNFGHEHTYLYDRLVPPGDIFYFVRDSEKEDFVLETSCFGNFADPLIAPGMFWSHLPSQYEQAFKNLLLYNRRVVVDKRPLNSSSSGNLMASGNGPPQRRPPRADAPGPARPPRSESNELLVSSAAQRAQTRVSTFGAAPITPDNARSRSPSVGRPSADARATRFLMEPVKPGSPPPSLLGSSPSSSSSTLSEGAPKSPAGSRRAGSKPK